MPRAGLTTDAVLDAASDLADKEGLAAVTLAAPCRPARRAPALALQACRWPRCDPPWPGGPRPCAKPTARCQRATVGKARDEALFAFAHAYWQFARERPGLYAASVRAAKPGENDIAAAGEALIGIVLSVLAGYGVTGDDALHATRGLRAIIHGFVSLDAMGGFRLKLDLDEILDRLLTAFTRDLATRGAAVAA